jgi:TPR repeat protein
MAGMNIKGGSPPNEPRRPGTAGGRPSQDANRRPPPPRERAPPGDNYGRPSLDGQRGPPPPRAPPGDGYGRPSLDSQRGPPPPRGFTPQQAPQGFNGPPPEQRRPPPNNFGKPPPMRQNGMGSQGRIDNGYGPPANGPGNGFEGISRSYTLPIDMGTNAGPMHGGAADFSTGPSAPYNGPIGRNIPPRPSTAGGTRPPPQRAFQSPVPNQVQPPIHGSLQAPLDSNDVRESISDFYDAYYYPPPGAQRRPSSVGSDMPDFDVLDHTTKGQNEGTLIDQHIQPGPEVLPPPHQQNGYGQVARSRSQPDLRARAQAQTAEIYEMSSEVPAMPNGYGYQNDPYGMPGDQYGNQMPLQQGPPPSRTYGSQHDQRSGVPQRSMSGGQRLGFGNMGPPTDQPPMNGNGMYPPGMNSMTKGPSPTGESSSAHPTPVRPGLMQNSGPTQSNTHPAPVRQYNNASPAAKATAPAPAPSGSAPPVTQAELDSLRQKVRNSPNDLDAQLVLARKMIEASDVLVAKIADQRARAKARERYIFDAHKMLKKLAAIQHTDSMFFLADCYGRGSLGLETDNKEAFTLYQGAAKAGHAAAAYRTAVCCELGSEEGGGTRKDPLKAMQWYKRAAALGDTPAMYKMGMIMLKGLLGQQRNPREAIGWLKRAADNADSENPHALHELGLLYESASGNDAIVRDEAYSFSLFKRAAELGYKYSQFRLGCAYEYGLFGLPISPRDSIMWYSRAAVQEEHQSELALSGWYLTGSEGVLQQSDTEAYLWARKAAMAGLAKAEYAMGYFTEVGIGAPSNLEDAKRWYWRAAGMFLTFFLLVAVVHNRLTRTIAQNFPKARERLEDLKKGGSKPALKSRERISRSKVGKQNEGECSVM